MIDEQSPASGHDYALDRSAIGAGKITIEESTLMHSEGQTDGGGGGGKGTSPLEIGRGKII